MVTIWPYGEEEKQYLADRDSKMAQLIVQFGNLERSVTPDLFQALVSTIIGQQISTAAAETIKKRLHASVGILTPERLLSLTEDSMREIGLSRPKIRYLRAIAEAFAAGEFSSEIMENLSFAEIGEKLLALPGIGPWSVDMLLIFTFMHPDILSIRDLGIRRGLLALYELDEISEETYTELFNRFSPYNTVASFYIWEYSNNLRSERK